MPAVPTVRLAKYHGLANDFLVLVVDDGTGAPGDDEHVAMARAACDRHRGIGADGLMVCSRSANSDADLVMRLRNADGSLAEMSGNGIRCFVHAALDAGLVAPGTIRVHTDGGLRVVEVESPNDHGLAQVSVSMGAVVLDAFAIPESVRDVLKGRRATTVRVGNPHIVIEADPASIDLPVFGPAVEEWYLSTDLRGINVEVVVPSPGSADSNVLNMAVWERGVGITQACGTGAVATAAAARSWGLVTTRAVVRQPGGEAGVLLADTEATLIGPSQFIGRVDFAWSSPGPDSSIARREADRNG